MVAGRGLRERTVILETAGSAMAARTTSRPATEERLIVDSKELDSLL